jgi:hypothetical protein
MTSNQLFVHTAINGRHNAIVDRDEKEILNLTVAKWDKGKNMYPYKVWVLYGTHKDSI